MGTVTKALELLNLFTRMRPAVGLSDLARLAGLNKATCHRLLTELQAAGLVEQVGVAREYRLGPAVLRLAALREEAVPMQVAAQPVLERLAEITGETAHLSMMMGDRLQVLAFAYSSAHGTQVMMNDADTLPFHATSSGLAVLAFLPAPMRERVLSAPMQRLTPLTETSPEMIRQRMGQVLVQGHSESAGGYEADVHSLAVPLFAGSGTCVGALAVAAPSARMTADLRGVIRSGVLRAGAEITALWGGTAPAEIAAFWRDAA